MPLSAAPAAEARRRGRVLDVDALGDQERHGRRPHRLDHDLLRGHQVDRLVEVRPVGAELTGLLVGGGDLDDLVDLGRRHVAHVLRLEDAEGLERVADVLHDDAGVLEQRDLALPLLVQELLPADLVRQLLEDIGVVADRVGVEVRGRTDDLPGHRAPRRAGPLVDHPLDDVLVGPRPFLGQRQPGRSLLEEERPERSVAVTIGFAARAGWTLP